MSNSYHDLYECQTVRTAWHEAGHAVVALMNDVESVCGIYLDKYRSAQQMSGSLGKCVLDSIAHGDYYDTYMPAEFHLAGCAAEAILTGESPYRIWDEYWDTGVWNDKTLLDEKFPEMMVLEFEAAMDNALNLLSAHKAQVRQVAKRLLRRGEVVGYRHRWLRQIAESLTPMENPALVEAKGRAQRERERLFSSSRRDLLCS